MPTDDTWDIFLAYATLDENTAESLHERLTAESGLRVFFAKSTMQPGDRWKEKIAKALAHSRIVAVLHSNKSRDALYQSEEVNSAVNRARSDTSGFRVVPIYLDGDPSPSDPSQLGLSGFHSIDVQREGLDGTANKLASLLVSEAVTDDVKVAAPGSSERQSSSAWLHAFGMSLDRTKQWHLVVDACRGDDSAYFLACGHRRQCVQLFSYRMRHYLMDECDRHHEFVSVPFKLEYTKPASAAAWVNHLRQGLGATNATVEDALFERARRAPVFLMIGNNPLEKNDLGDDHREALAEFLEERLPKLITRAARFNPVRVLVTTQYEDEDDSLVPLLSHAMKKGATAHSFACPWLQPLEDVDWEDIKSFLLNREPRPPNRVVKEIQAGFELLRQGEDLDFRDIVEFVDRMNW